MAKIRTIRALNQTMTRRMTMVKRVRRILMAKKSKYLTTSLSSWTLKLGKSTKVASSAKMNCLNSLIMQMNLTDYKKKVNLIWMMKRAKPLRLNLKPMVMTMINRIDYIHK